MKNYYTLLFLLLISVFVPLFAQESTPPWNKELQKAEDLFNKFQFDAALPFLTKAIEKTIAQYETASPELAELYHKIGKLYQKRNILAQAENYFEKSISIYSQLDTYPSELATIYNNKALILQAKGNMKAAKASLRKGFNLKEQLDESLLATLYNTLGAVYYNEGKEYEKALENFEEGLQLRRKAYGEVHEKVAISYNNVGVMHLSLFNNPDAALENYQKAANIYKQLPASTDIRLANVYDNFGEVYAEKKAFPLAKKYRTKALKERIKKVGMIHPATAVSYENLARDLVSQERYEEAMPLYQKSNFINTTHYGKRHRYVPRGYKHQAQAFLAWGKPDSALLYLQHAIIGAMSTFDNLDVRSNPNLEEQTIYEKPRLLEVLTLKAEIFYQKAQETKAQEDLKQSLDAYNLAIQLIDKLREEYERSNSKASLLEKAMSVYEGAITTNYELHQHSGDAMYMDAIFKIIEKSKSTLLLESLREDEAKAFAGIPESLISSEESLQYDLFSAEKRLFEAQQSSNEAAQKQIPNFKKSVRDIRKRSDALIRVFEEEYPDYHHLKYAIQLASIDDIKKLLPDPTHSLIAYFVGEKYIYAFILQQNKTKVIQIAKDFPLETWITELRRSIVNSTNSNNTADAEILVQRAHALYQKLFLPIKKQINLSEGITIIPGGVLGYLPFEMLIQTANEEARFFNAHHYLIHDYAICYSYSATLFKEMKEREHKQASKDFLAFAPSFSASALASRVGTNKTTPLANLEYNIPEVKSLQALIGGDIYFASTATKQTFLATAPHYKVVHLATHGVANDKVGDYAFLAFYKTDDTLSNQLLYNRDLYDLKLQADLVVLSACETGIGELKSGEGIISLARGFSYAGAKSILTTLWNINDAKTQELMQSFYTYLKAGKTKDVALRQAKLDFLEKYSHSAHPFYWAAFVPVGDMQAIDLGKSFSYWWLLALGLIPFLIWGIKKRA